MPQVYNASQERSQVDPFYRVLRSSDNDSELINYGPSTGEPELDSIPWGVSHDLEIPEWVLEKTEKPEVDT